MVPGLYCKDFLVSQNQESIIYQAYAVPAEKQSDTKLRHPPAQDLHCTLYGAYVLRLV